MKKIVCELCEGMEFTKEDGMFVCQGCGTKYTTEEARSMMQEVEGSAPISTAIPTGVPVSNPNQQQIDNILVLATTAYEAQNYAEAENYCNRAIELDAMCYKAWNLKGKAVGWQSKVDNLRIEEASHSFCKAIDFAPDEEKEELKNQAVEELKRLGLALIDLRKKRFSGSPDTQEMNGFTSDKKTIVDALLVLLAHGNAVGMPEGYLDQVATMMNEAGVAALSMARNAWNDVEHPSQKDLSTYLDWNGNICMVFRQSIATSDEDDEADIQRYKNLIIALKDPIGKHSKTRQWNSVWNRYDSEILNGINDCSKDYADVTIETNLEKNEKSTKPINKSDLPTNNEDLDEVLKELDELIGLENVKKEVLLCINLLKINQIRKTKDLPELQISNHIVFTGNPGTGKTTVARIMAKIYKCLGVVSKGQLVETDRSGMVAGYMGQTALKTAQVIKKAKGGVLFIDEAYSLSSDEGSQDYGKEAIDTLVKGMEDFRDDLVVIVAGYVDEMKKFISMNPGLRSRFNKYINFENYSHSEMLDIFKLSCKKAEFILLPEAEEAVLSYFSQVENNSTFGNARGVRNFFDKVVTNQATRILKISNPSEEEFRTISQEDIY